GILPGVASEWMATRATETMAAWLPSVQAYAWGPGAWALLGLLAVVLIVALWERCAPAAVVGLLILALTVPILTSGAFEPARASGPALRWGLAACFFAVSLPIWARHPLYHAALRWGCQVGRGHALSALCRGLLVLAVAIPVVVSTVLVVIQTLQAPPLGAAEGSFFARMPWLVTFAGPLVLVAGGVFGHGVGEWLPACGVRGRLVRQ